MNRKNALLVAWLIVAACGVADAPAPADDTDLVRTEPTPKLEAELVELRFQWPMPHLLEGERRYVAVEAIDELGNVTTRIEPTWRSSDPNILVVDDDGQVIGLREGRAEILAAFDGLEASLSVEIRSADPARIDLSASWLSIDWSEEAVVHATVYNNTGVMLARPVHWWSDNPDVATVDGGTITGVRRGSALIHASSGAAHAELHVEVVDPMPSRIEISPRDVTLQQGAVSQLELDAFAANGEPVLANPRWTSLDTSVVVADQSTGRLKAVGVGEADVEARVGQVTDRITVRVVGAGND